jgi:transcriptional regulator with AAA-type ATPase domain
MRGDAFQRCFRNYVHVPPLRERKDAIPALFEGFVRSATLGRHFDSFLRDDVKEKLLSYDFPGNVRELKNILERAVAETRNSPLQAEDIHFPKAASGNRLTTPDEQRVADAETDKLYEDYIRVKAAFDGYPEYPGDYDEGRLKGRTFTIDECRFPELVTQSIFRREPRIDGRTLAYIYGLSEGVERQRLRKYKLKLPDRQ